MVSFIIVNYECAFDTNAAALSILDNYVGEDYEILIVDNNSSENLESCLVVDKHIRVIHLDKNYGFGKANNVAAKEALGDILVLLNSDAILVDKHMHDCIEIARKESCIGVVGPKLFYPSGVIQPSGQNYPSLPNVLLHILRAGDLGRKLHIDIYSKAMVKFLPGRIKDYFKNYEVDAIMQPYDWISAACMIIKKDLYELLGGFNEDIFLYGEDIDFCYRIGQLGLMRVVYRDCKVIHKAGSSAKKNKVIRRIRKESADVVMRELLSSNLEYQVFKRFFLPIWY